MQLFIDVQTFPKNQSSFFKICEWNLSIKMILKIVLQIYIWMHARDSTHAIHWLDTWRRRYFSEVVDRQIHLFNNPNFITYTYTRFYDTVYPKKYAQDFCFAVLCCGYTLTDFPTSIRLTSLALWQSNDCPSASKATLMNMDKCFLGYTVYAFLTQ